MGNRKIAAIVGALSLAGTSLACLSPILGEDLPGGPTRLRVYADEAWTDTGIDIRAGDRLSIEAVSGEWSPWAGGSYDALGSGGDPRCDCNVLLGASHAALIGRIGDGRPFLVGDDFLGASGEAGRLFLGINDTRLEDNDGSIRVRVEVIR